MRAPALIAATLVLVLSTQLHAAGERIEMSGVTFVAGQLSEVELVLWAERAEVDVERQIVDLERVHVSVAAGEGYPGLELRCRRGRLDLVSNDFRLEGDVSGRSADGRRFHASWVGFEQARSLLYSDDPVVIYEAGGVYRGGRLRLELESRRLQLLEGVAVVRTP